MSPGVRPISFSSLSLRSCKLARNLARWRLSRNARQHLFSRLKTFRVDAIGGPAASFSEKASLCAAMASGHASAKASAVASLTKAMGSSTQSLAASLPDSDVAFVSWSGIGCSCCRSGRERGQTKGPVRCRRGLVKRSRGRIPSARLLPWPSGSGSYVYGNRCARR